MQTLSEESIFSEALRHASPNERNAYLDRACAGNADLRRSVEALLRAHEKSAGILEATPPGLETIAAPPLLADRAGAVIGRYKLLECIGTGGMGAVYMAEQQHPVRRTVALKLIKPGMDSAQVIARFEAERQALALMDHPNIAKVLDAGTTDAGLPYFVMELVRGVPLTEYCDRNALPPRQRLELFVQVCHAVQHAHQKGIIHRDLKPTNVLVTLHDGKPVPKVIDFGVAKAISGGGPLTDRTLFTHFAQMVGTPLYMSPEQAEMSGLDIDTRSDVYSLGVLLYELLTGTTPFDKDRLRQAALDEVRRIIREEDPPRPSTRLSTLGQALAVVSKDRGTAPKRLGALVRGELDWIVMKALEKDRTRRYETTGALAADVARYLDNQPIEACPPSRAYRLRKLAMRNRPMVAMISAVASVLIVVTASSTWLALRAIRAEARTGQEAEKAKRAAATAEAIAAFLNEDLLAQADPFNTTDRDLKLRTVLDRAAERIEGRFPEQPLVEAAVRHIIGHTYERLGELRKAEPHLRRAIELRRSTLGADHADTLNSQNSLYAVLANLGRYADAEAVTRLVLDARRRTLGEQHVDTVRSLGNWADTLLHLGRAREAAKLHERVLEFYRRELGPGDARTLQAMHDLAVVYIDIERFAQAEQLLRDSLAGTRKLVPDQHPKIGYLILNLGSVLLDLKRFDEAEALLRNQLEVQRRALPPDHHLALKLLGNLGYTRYMQADHTEAEMLWKEQLERSSRSLGEENPLTLSVLGNLAGLAASAGDFAEAQRLYRRALEGEVRTLPADHPQILQTKHAIARMLTAEEKFTEALDVYDRLLEARRRVLGDGHSLTVQTLRDRETVQKRADLR